MRQQWRRLMPGSRHGLSRGVAVYGAPQSPDPGQLRDLLSGCENLRAWARLRGRDLGSNADDLRWLDEAIDREPTDQGRDAPSPAMGNDAGLFLGTVIVATVRGARWQLRPNGHPLIRLASGRELDVVAVAHDRVATGQSRLIDVYTNAASNR